jgi:hypothetical protein
MPYFYLGLRNDFHNLRKRLVTAIIDERRKGRIGLRERWFPWVIDTGAYFLKQNLPLVDAKELK